jgi:hypothetical protein
MKSTLSLCLIYILFLSSSVHAQVTSPAADMILHASFDDVTDLNLFDKNGWIYTAASPKRDNAKQGLNVDSVSIAKGQGRYRDALKFSAKSDQVLFYQGSEFGYKTKDWSGTVSLWMKLDPNKDLEPGFCDPIQITERGWNDGAFFVDFDKDLPRDFRLGVFPDYAFWNPADTKFDDIPLAERPMVTVKNPPFNAKEWTHVCFTWENINSSDSSPATTTLYLNGKSQGSLKRPMKFTWEPSRVGIMIGVYFVGLMDDLIIFNKSLSAEQVELLYQHPEGGLK